MVLGTLVTASLQTSWPSALVTVKCRAEALRIWLTLTNSTPSI